MPSASPPEFRPRSTPRAMRLLAAALAGGLGAFACPIAATAHTPTAQTPTVTAQATSGNPADRPDR